MMLNSIRQVDALLTSRIRQVPIGAPDVLADLLSVTTGGQEIEQVFRLIPRIYDAPLNLSTLPQLREPTLLLCRAAASALELRIDWLPVIETFFDLLKMRVPHKQRANMKRYPFTFHAVARRQAIDANRLTAYETLALRSHVALRYRESQMKKFGSVRRLDNLYRYSLGIGTLIRYANVADLAAAGSLDVPVPVAVVKAAYLLAGEARGYPTQDDWNQTLNDAYGRCLSLFCTSKPVYPRYRRGESVSRCRPLRMEPKRRSYIEKVDNRETIIAIQNIPEAIEEAESPWDYARTVDVPNDEEQSSSLLCAWRRPLRIMISTPWTAGIPQPPELHLLFRSLRDMSPDNIPRNDIVLALTSGLILHHGAEPATVFGMGRARSETSSELWIDSERSTVSHNLPDELPGCQNEQTADPADYLPSGGVVELPLLPPLRGLVHLYEGKCQGDPPSDTYLQLDCPQKGLRPATLADLVKWLDRISSTLTPARLRSAFTALYGWAGLEPILCAFISSRLPAGLRATAFYVNISAQELAKRYAAAHRRVLNLIAECL